MLDNKKMIELLGSLKDLSSEQLSQLIKDETAKESPNDDLVMRALDILEDREKDEPVKLGPKGETAWKKYQSKARSRDRKTVLIWKPMMQVASVLMVITLLFALLPTQANAETWWERLARWTDEFFAFINPKTSEVLENEYIFHTDNEGLQQIYDAVVEFGVSEPVVPMWLPENYELVELKEDVLPNQKFLFSVLSYGNSQISFQVRTIHSEIPYQYTKDKSPVKTHEIYGTIFNIIKNNERLTVTWSVDNTECALSIDCQEETIYEIIESIYRRRDN